MARLKSQEVISIEKKKMGRPADKDRNKRLSLRISEDEMKDIEYCADKLSTTKIDTVVKAVSMLKKEIDNK